MNIGIITFHNADNYGAVLQCYALQKYLLLNHPEHNISVIDYRNNSIEKTYKSFLLTKNFRKLLSQMFYFFPTLHKQKAFSRFRKEYLRLSNVNLNQFDCIIYGSDQIWNSNIINNDLIFFGDKYNGKKISYAASDGGEIQLNESVVKLLNNYSCISCREKSLLERLQNNLSGKDLYTVCDPVFLLSKNDWLQIAKKPKESDYILAYQISKTPNFDEEVERLGHNLNKNIIQIVYIKTLNKFFYKKQNIKGCLTPQEFVGYLAYADFIVTTSFHGTAFSLIFNKPFYVLSFGKRSERITDLLRIVNLEKQFGEVVKYDDFSNNYQGLLDLFIKKSKDFLDMSLKV